MSPPPTARRGIVAILRGELRFLVGTAWRGLWRCGAVCFLLAMAFVVWAIVTAEPQPGRAPQTWGASDILSLVLVAAGYGAYLAFFPSLVAAFLYVAYKLTGPWMLFPIFVVPACVALSLWLFSGLLAGQVDEVWQAVRAAADEHEWAVLAIGPMARAGPIALVIALPLLVVDLGVLAVQPSVLGELLSLAAWAAFALFVGLVPSLGSSLVVLLVAYGRRVMKRHRAAAAAESGSNAASAADVSAANPGGPSPT